MADAVETESAKENNDTLNVYVIRCGSRAETRGDGSGEDGFVSTCYESYHDRDSLSRHKFYCIKNRRIGMLVKGKNGIINQLIIMLSYFDVCNCFWQWCDEW
jgi:hypothetical protein